ncbi:hypothetical protein PMAYCL1PPCAC_14638, partial [Pristionchus mayeri]
YYFAHADVKYKSDKFWMDIGYEPGADPTDYVMQKSNERKIMEMIGYRVQCADCHEFWPSKVGSQDFVDSLEAEKRLFRCSNEEIPSHYFRGNARGAPRGGCRVKTPALLSEEEVK